RVAERRRVAVAVDRGCAATVAAHHQHVGTVTQQTDTDHHARERTLQDQPGADREQHRRGECEERAHGAPSSARSGDAGGASVTTGGSPPNASNTMKIRPTTRM